MIVVDTNVISYLFINGDNSKYARKLLVQDSQWIAPVLWKSEFRNVLALYLRQGHFSLQKTLSLLHESEHLMRNAAYEINSTKVMQLVSESKCSAYDCEFVVLAQELSIPLITLDKKLIKEFPKTAHSLKAYVKG